MSATHGAASSKADLVDDLKEVGRHVFGGALGGFACGFVVGGLGGRLAMLILRLTTGSELEGLESDDGFIMGSFTSATLFLVGMTSFLGAFLGIIYSFVRGWLPERTRRIATATFFGLVGGAAIIHPGGVDFTALRPLWLAIALFILLPGLFGFALSATVDRLLERPAGRVVPWLGLALAMFALVVIGVGGLRGALLVPVLVVALLALLIASRKFPAVRALPRAPAVVWLARTALIAGAAVGAFMLANDIVQVL
jgi:hypothetical protein